MNLNKGEYLDWNGVKYSKITKKQALLFDSMGYTVYLLPRGYWPGNKRFEPASKKAYGYNHFNEFYSKYLNAGKGSIDCFVDSNIIGPL